VVFSSQLLRNLHDQWKALENVGNHISRSDEIPEIVALPVGFYTVVARAEKAGYIRVPVVINEGRETILDLDVWEVRR
jgi:hypothetical protein